MKTFNNLLLPSRAKSFPAITPNIAKVAIVPHGGDRWNNRMVSRSLNFFDKYGTCFHYPNGLISAGVILGPDQTNKPKPMMTDRDRRPPDTKVLLDSGGFGIKMGTTNFHGDPTRKAILGHTLDSQPDAAITLDFPPLAGSRLGYPDYQRCRDITVENLAYIVQHCPEDRLGLFLNVLQGETEDQAADWYNAVRRFPFNHWAFAGARYKDMSAFLAQLVVMLDDGALDQTYWIHILGGYRLTLACALTTVRETLVELLDRSLLVTYDNAYIFNQTNKRGKCLRAFNLTKRGFSLSFDNIPDEPKYVGSMPIGLTHTPTRYSIFQKVAGHPSSVLEMAIRDERVFSEVDGYRTTG